jgi:hypothetical protein
VDRCAHHHLFKEKNLISMLQATVQSSLIECKYHFTVSCDYDSVLCCSQRPMIEIPIIMYIPDIRPNVQLYQPNNWNPTTMPMLEINLPSYSEVVGNQNQNVSNQGMNMTVQTQAIRIEQGAIVNSTKAQGFQGDQDVNKN